MFDVDLVLAPADCSDEAERAAEYAVAVANAYGADLHVLFVMDERVQRGLEAGDVDAHAVADEQDAFRDSVEATAADRGRIGRVSTSAAVGFSTDRLSQTPGSVVLDVADELDADFVVIPREPPSGEPNATLAKAALYVLEYASQPVLSV